MITWHFYNYARMNAGVVGTHAFGARVVWIHCRHGVLLPGGQMVRFTCSYIDSKGGHGFIFQTYHWFAQAARGMIIRNSAGN